MNRTARCTANRAKTGMARQGAVGVRDVGNLLRHYGLRYKVMNYNDPFDLLISNKYAVEVKTAHRQVGENFWRVNIHRHGKVEETGVDFYLFRLVNVPYSNAAIHLLEAAPVGKKVITISFRSLLNGKSESIARFYRFVRTGNYE